jgi:CubicO group peptidase (beta-lactamase class C family)
MVTTAYPSAKPEDLGIDPEKLEAVFARAQRDVEQGVLPSCQVAVARHGRLAGMRTFGAAVQGGETRPATAETMYHVFSSTKAVVAAAAWLLIESGDLRLDERVAEIIPEFATNGKDAVTVEQVFLHTSGFPLAPFAQDKWGDRNALLRAFAQWRLNWEPDSRFEYHATSAHWVLSEIIHRRGGSDYRTFIRDRITGPMGLDELYVGCPPEQQHRVAGIEYIGEHVPPPGGWGEVTPELVLNFNKPAVRAAGVPGGGAVASAATMALFYQVLINGGQTADGRRVLKPETIDFATQVRTKEHHYDQALAAFNPEWKCNVNRALSVVVAGDDGFAALRGFGRTASGKAFGHGGAGGQIAWGDPVTGISVGYCTNGFVDFMTLGRRGVAISSLAGSCLA